MTENQKQGYLIRSFMTSPAIIRPATDGTKEMLPGTCRRTVHCVQFLRTNATCSATVFFSFVGFVGFLSIDTLVNQCPVFELSHNFARGHIGLYMSTSNLVGSSLFLLIALIIGIFSFCINNQIYFAVAVSMALTVVFVTTYNFMAQSGI